MSVPITRSSTPCASRPNSFDNASAFSIMDGFKPKNSCINIIEFVVVYCFDLSFGVALCRLVSRC